MSTDKFEWQEAKSAPPGYPIEVYTGGLQSKNGFTSLYSGTTLGLKGWGTGGGGMSSGLKTIPNHLHVIWVSYFEHKFYEIDTPIDYEKMVSLFNEGYYEMSFVNDPNAKEPSLNKTNYKTIMVGFAPGGVVVIWVAGAGRQIEVGRYQGKEITFTQKQIDELPSGPKKNMHNIEYHNNILYHWKMVPKEIVDKVKDKPVPYGLWDTYHKKYNWQLSFEFLHQEKIKDVFFDFYNGEREELFGAVETEKYPEIPESFRWTTHKVRPTPKLCSFIYVVESSEYGCSIKFDEEEIFKAFRDVFGDSPNTEAELVVYINDSRTDATVALKSKDKEIALFNSNVSIGKRK
ncbi:hypothetical protein CAPN001_24450 [Capnocytophaga stomatis]|uniref:DUF2931 family protein n=1 Tax=Capnocytophaga stomatis TaxID=1848904 RepID=UPI001A3F57DC|nr:DUF2931 family protein [Capnocytophaga stomatis]GIJ97876.1 hypothetical protein CAPN001_24450 [Capnocytophaga stomatis]